MRTNYGQSTSVYNLNINTHLRALGKICLILYLFITSFRKINKKWLFTDKYGQIMNQSNSLYNFWINFGAHVKICLIFLSLYKFFLRVNQKFLFMDKYKKIVNNQIYQFCKNLHLRVHSNSQTWFNQLYFLSDTA